MSYYTAGQIMDSVAVLMNDSIKSLYSYSYQLPYLRMAAFDLEQEIDIQEGQINLISESEIQVPIGALMLSLPSNFFLPISLAERKYGQTSESNFIPMVEVDNVGDQRRIQVQQLTHWDYRHNCINFVGSIELREVRLYYMRSLGDIQDENSFELQRGGFNYLAYHTAELISKYSAMNLNRAAALAIDSEKALDRILTLNSKNNQARNRVRRKPFRINTRGYYRVSIP